MTPAGLGPALEVDLGALVPATVFIPLAFSILAALAPRASRTIGALGTLANAAVALTLVAAVAADGTQRHVFGGWGLPLGLQVRADGLAAVFLALGAVVGSAITLYALADRRATTAADPHTPPGEGGPGQRGFWPTWLLLLAGLNAAFVAGDLFNAYVALEIVGLAAVGLVGLGGQKAWRAAFDYLIVAVAGSLLFLLAVGVVYSATGTLDMALAGERLTDPATRRLVLALGLLGLAFKAALVPLHGWLPAAHGSAPAAVSPALSGLVVKAAWVLSLRLWFEVTGPDRVLAVALGVLACAAVLWGGAQALRQEALKRLVAYSTVAQVGYLYLVFPLTAFATDEVIARAAWTGAVLMAVAHGLAKAALFMSAGTILNTLGSDRLVDVVGVSRTLPMVALASGVAAISLAGLPISAGFAAKWQLAIAGVAGGQLWLVALLVLGALLGSAYLLRPVATMFRDADESQEVGRRTPVRPRLLPQVAPLALAVLVVALGLRATDVAALALVGLPWGVAP